MRFAEGRRPIITTLLASLLCIAGCGSASSTEVVPGTGLVVPATGPVASPREPTCGPTVRIDAHDVCLDPTPRDYLDAERNCRALGGGLFELTSHERSMGVKKSFGIVANEASMWIGVFRANGGPWQLAHSGKPPPIEQWGEGEPNDAGGDEDCVEVLRNGRWNDAHCGVLRPFACEPRAGTSAPIRCLGTVMDGGKVCLHAEQRSFLFAQRACEEDGARLLTVDSYEDGQRLTDMMAAGSGDVWFGFSDLAEEGTWKTKTNARPRHAAWRYGEPNDAGERGEDCAVVGLHDAEWNDVPCDVKTRSLCSVAAARR